MRLFTAILAGLLPALPALAHESQGLNGGRMTDAGRYHVELVVRDRTVDVYVSDGGARAVPAAGFRGTAILVVDGKPLRVPLETAADRLTGLAAVPVGDRPRGAVRLVAPDGTSASGTFN